VDLPLVDRDDPHSSIHCACAVGFVDGHAFVCRFADRSAAEEPTASQALSARADDSTTPGLTASANVEAASPEDADVAPATHSAVEPGASKTGSRYLAPPSAELTADHRPSGPRNRPASDGSRELATFGLPMRSSYTVLSALAIVIGVFLLFAWVLKRGGRGIPGRRGTLPTDVVSVLGRVPLAARQFAELLRVGNKLVLVSLTPNGAETLTEITDAAEVDRLLGLCQQNNPFSTTKAFEQVFQQMSGEPAPSGFIGNEPFMGSLASPVGAYRANRGGAARG
jgi:flagellar biogenesis protein FliO